MREGSNASLASCAARPVLPPVGRARGFRRRTPISDRPPSLQVECRFDPALSPRSGRPSVPGHRNARAVFIRRPVPLATQTSSRPPAVSPPRGSLAAHEEPRARASPEPRRTPPPRLGACAPTGVVAAFSSVRMASHPPRRHVPVERDKRGSRLEDRRLFAEPPGQASLGPTKHDGPSPKGRPMDRLLRP